MFLKWFKLLTLHFKVCFRGNVGDGIDVEISEADTETYQRGDAEIP